jgi:hypothetical protein
MALWNISYKITDEYLFVEAMNNVHPGTYNLRRTVSNEYAQWVNVWGRLSLPQWLK